MDTLRVELLGPLRVIRTAGGSVSEISAYPKILGYLAVNLGNPRSRRQLEADLFPDVDGQVIKNRMRVALTKLRRQLGPALIEGSDGLAFDPDFFSTDLQDVAARLDELRHEVDERREADALLELLPRLSTSLLPDEADEWAVMLQAEWIETAVQALKRLVRLTESQSRFDAVLDGTQAALLHRPYDPTLWVARIKGFAGLDLLQKGISEFSAARMAYRKLGGDFDKATLARVRDLNREGLIGKRRFEKVDPQDIRFLGEAVATMIEEAPIEAAELFRHALLERALVEAPPAAARLLDVLLESVPPENPHWPDLAASAVVAHAGNHRADRVLELTDLILEHAMERSVRAKAYLHRAFAQVQTRDYEEGLRTLDIFSKEMSDDPEDPIHFTIQSQRATFLWQLARYDEAMAIYEQALTFFALQSTPLGAHKHAITIGNVGIMYATKGDLESARPYLENAYQLSQEISFDRIMPILLPTLGFVWLSLDQPARGAEAIVDGLRRAFKDEDNRAVQVGLDFACGALAHAGELDFAASILLWNREWRKGNAHDWSVAEGLFARRIMDRALPPIQPIPADTDPAVLLREVVKRLRKSAKSRSET